MHKHERQTNSDLEASVTKVLGKWSLKSGIEFLDDFTSFQDFEEGSTRLDTSSWCTNCGSGYTAEFITSTGGNTAQDTTPMISGFDAADLLLGVRKLLHCSRAEHSAHVQREVLRSLYPE